MQAQHHAQQTIERRETLQLRVGPPDANSRPPSQDRATLSPESLSAAAEAGTAESDGLTPNDRLKVNIIRHLYKLITGREMVAPTPGEIRQALQGSGAAAATPSAPAPETADSNSPAQSAGFGLAFDAETTLRETETTAFAAAGIIKTADGQEIQFTLQATMSREFAVQQRVSLTAGDPIKVDPLVINYAGTAAELGDARFEFDLDSDGDMESIANLKPGSALLALDRNGNGAIDNGQELFGPTSGDGLAELARYDDDGNGFIDSGDAVFGQLRLWQRDDSGDSKRVALGQVGIGAIYLGSAKTPFQLNDAQNRNLGQVASTGLFFREDGSAGTVQQVDYTV
jgi:hypothetical protein